MPDTTIELHIRRLPDASLAADAALTSAASAAASQLAAGVPIILDIEALLALSGDPAAYGAALAAQLFAAQQLRDAWLKANAYAAAGSLQLRLRLDHGADDLHAIRWETLRALDTGQPIALHERVRLVRTLDTPDLTPVVIPPRPALHALVVVSNPSDLGRFGLAEVDVDGEVARARIALGDIPAAILGDSAGAAGRSTLTNLASRLRDGPHIVILVAHGTLRDGQPVLWLERDDGTADPVPGAAVVTAVERLLARPLLLILASCRSAGGYGDTLRALGAGLARAGVPAVLGFQGDVSIGTVKTLLPTLISELRRDGQIDRALAAARAALGEARPWWQAVLWLRTDGRLWEEGAARIAQLALHQLRAPVADFIGREAEVEALIAALTSNAAAAISGVAGMGGIGKTELALKVCHALSAQYPDAQLVINLQGSRIPVLSSADALRQVIRAFQPAATKLPADLTALAAQYRSLLSGKRVLILADDAQDAAQVQPLLPPSGSALLITSRQRFQLSGMRRIDLEQLAEAEAITLLQRICDRLNDAEAQQIAAACGWLPMALRVAGGILANDATIDVDGYLARLTDGRRALPALRDPDDPNLDVAVSLALSYELLSVESRRDLLALGIFAASFDRAAASAVLATASQDDLEARIGALYRRNLVEFLPQQGRYDLHELVRAFTLTQQGAAEDAARLRHAVHYIQIAEQAHRMYRAGGAQIASGLALFDLERANLDAARSWLQLCLGDPHCDALLIADADVTADLGEIRYSTQHERIPQLKVAFAAAARCGDIEAQARLQGSLGNAYATIGDNQGASACYRQALQIARTHGYRQIESITLGNLGVAYRNLGNIQHASACYREQLQIARSLSDRRSEASALGNLGVAYAEQGKFAQAIDLYGEQLTIIREIGDLRSEASALGNLGVAYKQLGNTQQATLFYKRRLEIVHALGDRQGIAESSWNLGIILEQQGALAEALGYLEAGLAFYQDLGHPRAAAMNEAVLRMRRSLERV